jgi:RNA polymerase sigma factor (sigma-70 family)
MPLFRENPSLLPAFREGRREALETVYRYYARSLDGYLRALSHWAGAPEFAQPSVVQDLMQETFIRAFSDVARRSYDPGQPFTPYLRTIARNCFIDQLRKRRPEVPVEVVEPSLTLEATNGDETYDPRVVLTLEAYLRDLPEALRGVYEQRFVRGLSQVEACDALGLSRRSLRTQEEHLRRGLRKALMLAGLLHGERYLGTATPQASRS